MMLSIALCTYNGENYIVEQLESLSRQTLLPDEVVICDDGSSDATVARIGEFAKKAPFLVRVFVNAKSLGTIQNFSEAVGYCQGDYIALCDQDDVWMPDKLALSQRYLQEAENRWSRQVPLLVHADLRVVDASMHCLQESMMRAQGIQDESDMTRALQVLLVQNYVTGCTVIFNKALKDIAWPFPEGIVMHDWWLALIAASCGQILFLNRPVIAYRQHGDNQVGAKKYLSWASLKRFSDSYAVKRSIQKSLRQVCVYIRVAAQRCSGRIPSMARMYLRGVIGRRWCLVYKSGVHKQRYLRNLAFYFFLVCWGKEFSLLVKHVIQDEERKVHGKK